MQKKMTLKKWLKGDVSISDSPYCYCLQDIVALDESKYFPNDSWDYDGWHVDVLDDGTAISWYLL